MSIVFYYVSQFFNRLSHALQARETAGGYRNIQVYETKRGYRASRLQRLLDNHGFEATYWRGGLRQVDVVTHNGDTVGQVWARATRPRRG
jgi:hypothetical protein